MTVRKEPSKELSKNALCSFRFVLPPASRGRRLDYKVHLLSNPPNTPPVEAENSRNALS
jgi:hypothetical protein